MIAGVGIGVLIGLITGTVALVLLRTVNAASIKNTSSVVAVTTEILAIPTFWFGGPWVTSSILELVELQSIVNPYLVALTLTFTAMIVYPIVKWIIRLAEELGREVK